jgi:hypothetical protein
MLCQRREEENSPQRNSCRILKWPNGMVVEGICSVEVCFYTYAIDSNPDRAKQPSPWKWEVNAGYL